MQLTGAGQPRRRSIREGLTAATCALIGMGAGVARAGEVDTATMLYSEMGRVTVLEGTVKGRRETGGNGRAIGFHLVLDALTGASANGAIPAGHVQTFTSPSGQSSYSSPAGETPLNDTFQDTRLAGGGVLEEPLGRLTKGTFGADLSVERDYSSFGASSLFSHDLFLRNTTLAAGISGSWDRVNPTGGPPEPFAFMQPPSPSHEDKAAGAAEEGGGGGPAESKTTVDFLAGLTQVLDRSSLMQLNYTVSRSSGYLTDPYKLLSVVDTVPGSTTYGDPVGYRYESRPPSRVKQSVFVETKHHFTKDVVDLSYRYMWDDWSVFSNTLDLRYQWQRDGPDYWEPHVRLYRQTAADAYTPYLVDGAALPAFASGDYRLGTMSAYTAGIKYGRTLTNGNRIGIRAEYYEQRNSGPNTLALGYNLYPTVGAGILQFDYSFDW